VNNVQVDNNKLVYRKMDINDLDLFIKLRLDFLMELVKDIDNKIVVKIKESLKNYFVKNLPENKFIGIICEYNNNVISTAFLSINEKAANPYFINGNVGTLLNVYTYPEYRRNGLSTKIMEIIIAEAKEYNLSEIDLEATNDGEKIYRRFGFKEPENKYMKLKLI
jgi:GNAT superfamily N-acetyltransferase